jgi:hypothetical protein
LAATASQNAHAASTIATMGEAEIEDKLPKAAKGTQ